MTAALIDKVECAVPISKNSTLICSNSRPGKRQMRAKNRGFINKSCRTWRWDWSIEPQGTAAGRWLQDWSETTSTSYSWKVEMTTMLVVATHSPKALDVMTQIRALLRSGLDRLYAAAESWKVVAWELLERLCTSTGGPMPAHAANYCNELSPYRPQPYRKESMLEDISFLSAKTGTLYMLMKKPTTGSREITRLHKNRKWCQF